MLGPSKTCPVPVCIPLCLSQLRRVGSGDFRRHWSSLWPAPLSAWFALVGGLAWTSGSQWVSPWWFRVWLALPRSALFPALADLPVPLLWGLVKLRSWLWKNNVSNPPLDIGQYIVLCSNLNWIMFYSEVLKPVQKAKPHPRNPFYGSRLRV